MLPRHGLFGTEGGFMDFGRRRHGADAAEVHPAHAEGIGAAERAANVVGAAHIVEYNYGSGAVPAAVFFRRDAPHFGGCEFAVFHVWTKIGKSVCFGYICGLLFSTS